MSALSQGVNHIGEALKEYEGAIVNGILAWLVQTSIATEQQLVPIRDGSYKNDLPEDFFRTKPKPLPTGLGDESTWPLGLRLPRADEHYFMLFGLRVTKLDRLHKSETSPRDFETVAQLLARREKALAGEHLPPVETLAEAEEAVDGLLRRTAQRIDDKDFPYDPRIVFLLDLLNRIQVLTRNWDEATLLAEVARLNRVAHLGGGLAVKRLHALYRLASLTRDGQWLRGYKSGLSKHQRPGHDDVEELLATARRNSQGVLAQLSEPQERLDWSAGLEQGVRDGFMPPAID